MKPFQLRTSLGLLFCLLGVALGYTASAQNQDGATQILAQNNAQDTDSVDGTGVNHDDAVLSVDGTGQALMNTSDNQPDTESVDGTGWRPSVDGTGVRHSIPANTGTSISTVFAKPGTTESVDGTGLHSVAVPAALHGSEEASPECSPAAEGSDSSANASENCTPVPD